MSESQPAPSAQARAARAGRALLKSALAVLQRPESRAHHGLAIESAAAASSALYEAESASSAASGYVQIRAAIKHLTRALDALQAACDLEIVEATETIARTLALLYPVARTHQRQRRRVVMDLDDPAVSSSPFNPPAPDPIGRPATLQSFAGTDKRAGGERVFVEVDLGLLSASNFYTGLSRDLSTGGVFVATYQPKRPGTAVTLYFVLPSGRAIHAQGVVRWTSEAAGDDPSGMGIAFQDISADDLRAIAEFCRARSPMLHEGSDD